MSGEATSTDAASRLRCIRLLCPRKRVSVVAGEWSIGVAPDISGSDSGNGRAGPGASAAVAGVVLD